ncbi:DUF222 domain-containing protein [Microbacterium sp. NPDC091313]
MRVDDFDDVAAMAELVDALVDVDQAIAALEADKVVHLASAMRIAQRRMARQPADTQLRQMEERSIAAEIAVATHVSDRSVQNRMHEALALVDDFPAVLDALADGRISARHATAITAAGAVLTDEGARAAYETAVLEYAVRETAQRTQKFAERVAEELHPRCITERYAQAIETRRVWVDDLGDGTSQLGVIASSVLVHGIADRLTTMAKMTKGAARPLPTDGADEADGAVRDQRTLDQTRADIATDLLLTGGPTIDPTTDTVFGGLGAVRAQVSVVIPATTAAGIHDRGASVEGACPVDAATARKLMAGASAWERVLTHPITGTVLAADTYRRPAALDRFLAVRDIHCRFPGCRQPARRCDRDHNRDWALGGKTEACNLACLCKRHHTLKTEKEWRAEQLADGSIRWRTPLGRIATDVPERYVVFHPDPVGDPDPPGAPPF